MSLLLRHIFKMAKLDKMNPMLAYLILLNKRIPRSSVWCRNL